MRYLGPLRQVPLGRVQQREMTGEFLRERVVQVPGDALAFLQHTGPALLLREDGVGDQRYSRWR
jgi:hypothetical protein